MDRLGTVRFSADELEDRALPTSVSNPVGDGCSWSAELLIVEAAGSLLMGGDEALDEADAAPSDPVLTIPSVFLDLDRHGSAQIITYVPSSMTI